MTTFHDRRRTPGADVDTVRSALETGSRDTFGKSLIADRFMVRGVRDPEAGRVAEFVVHEVLANGRVVERGRASRRRDANAMAQAAAPTTTYDI